MGAHSKYKSNSEPGFSLSDMNINRRQALIAGGLGTASMCMPGSVLGSDKLDARGNAVASDKSCIFVLLCGGPSHVDTWDMKPNAPESYRGPYKPIATKVPGMRINEMHTRLAKLTDQFTLINSMTHPGAISNHFDAMHNLLSGQSAKRVQQGVPDDQPYLGSFVARHKPSKRNIVSNAWLIKCVGRPVFCAPNLSIGGYLGSAYAPVFIGSANNHPAMENFTPPKIYDLADGERLAQRRKLLGSIESNKLSKDALGKDWSDLREKAYDAMTRPEGRQAFDQIAGHAVIAALDRQLGAFPASFLGQPALGFPELEQRIAGIVLRLADQPQALGSRQRVALQGYDHGVFQSGVVPEGEADEGGVEGQDIAVGVVTRFDEGRGRPPLILVGLAVVARQLSQRRGEQRGQQHGAQL